MKAPRQDEPLPGWLNVGTAVPIVLGVLGIAGIGFFGSFTNLCKAMQPYFHDGSWTVPIGVDTAIIVFTAVDLRAIRANVPIIWLRYAIYFLCGATIYFNTTSSPTFIGKAAHAIMPTLYIICVEAARAMLAKWVKGQRGKRMEAIPLAWWLNPFRTFPIWYRRHRWQIRTIDELVRREQARQLAVLRMKERVGVRRRFRPKWRREATADDIWAIDTYAHDGADPTMKKVANAITRQALAAPPPAAATGGPGGGAPEGAHTAAGGAVHAQRARRAIPGPTTPPGPQGDARAHTRTHTGAAVTAKWEKLINDDDGKVAWGVYSELRTELEGGKPQVKAVHAACTAKGVHRDRSTVSRWCTTFDAYWDAVHAHADGAHAHTDGAHATLPRARESDTDLLKALDPAAPPAREQPAATPPAQEPPVHTANGQGRA